MSINNEQIEEVNHQQQQRLLSTTSYSEYSPLVRQDNSIFVNNVQINSERYNENPTNKFSFRKLWKFTGPGFLMSVAYLDPGNLESDLQSGATTSYKLLWALLLSTVIGFILQMLAVRLGSTTGFHLAEICRKEYNNKFERYFLWIMIEIAIVSSDIQQVIGSSIALNILSRGYIPIWVAILITSADAFLFLLLENTGLRVLEAIFGVFILVMSASFMYMYIRVAPDQVDVIKGIFYPWCSNCSYIEIKQLVGIIGSIVMPHNIYFHSTLVLSRNYDRHNENAVIEANKYYAIESATALFISFLCNLFVISSFAKVFYGTPEANNVTLMSAVPYIRKEYGLTMQMIWAIGLLAAGQCSTMTGTYAGQFVMEGFTKISLTKWKRILIVRSIAIMLAITIALLALDGIDQLNFWCNCIQAIQLPFALLPVLHFTSSKRIMGSFKINLVVRIFCYMIAMFIIGINFYILVSLIINTRNFLFYILFGAILVIYALLISYYLLGVNNVYRIGLLLRRCCGTPNAEEIDELLHASPVYRHPPKSRKRDSLLVNTSINNPSTPDRHHPHYTSFSSFSNSNNTSFAAAAASNTVTSPIAAIINNNQRQQYATVINNTPPDPVIA